MLISQLKLDFFRYKIFSKFQIEIIMIDLNLSYFKISISVESYEEKTAENYRKLLHFRKAHSFQTIKDIDSKL